MGICITSCSTTYQCIDQNNVEYIKFWYYPKGVHTPIAITDCGEIVYDTQINKDTIIYDREIIQKYILLINKLKPIKKNTNYDLRVTSLIKTKREILKKNVSICISPLNGVVLIDDVLMKGNVHLINKFLDEVLYDHLTPDDWTPDFMREKLPN